MRSTELLVDVRASLIFELMNKKSIIELLALSTTLSSSLI